MAGTLSRHTGSALTAIAAAVCVFATPGSAQESTTRGFMVGAHVGLASVSIEGSERSSGDGGGLTIGYGLNRKFTIYGQFDGSSVDVRNQADDVAGTWALGHADLGLRFHFANSLRSWVPYLQAGISARVVTITDIPASSPD